MKHCPIHPWIAVTDAVPCATCEALDTHVTPPGQESS